jgi:hypothetical protein
LNLPYLCSKSEHTPGGRFFADGRRKVSEYSGCDMRKHFRNKTEKEEEEDGHND